MFRISASSLSASSTSFLNNGHGIFGVYKYGEIPSKLKTLSGNVEDSAAPVQMSGFQRTNYKTALDIPLTKIRQNEKKVTPDSLIFRIIRSLFLIVIHFIACFFLMRTILVRCAFWYNTVLTFECAVTAAIFDIVVINWKLLKRISNRSSLRFNTRTNRNASVFTLFKTRLPKFLVVSFVVAYSYTNFHYCLFVAHEHYLQETYLIPNAENLPEIALRWIVLSLWIVYSCPVRGGLLWMLLVNYANVCATVSEDLENLRIAASHEQGHRATLTSFKTLSTLRSIHHDIRNRVGDLQKPFGKALLLIHALFLGFSCIQITSFFTDESEFVQSAHGRIFFAFDVFYMFGVYLASTLPAALIAEKADDLAKVVACATIEDATATSPCSPNHIWKSLKVRQELQQFVWQTSFHPVALSVCNIFVVTKSAMLSVTSAVLTYVMIAIQLNPAAMTKLTEHARNLGR